MLQVVINCCSKVLQNIKCRLEAEIESNTQSIVVLNNLVRNIALQMELVASGIVCTVDMTVLFNGGCIYYLCLWRHWLFW